MEALEARTAHRRGKAGADGARTYDERSDITAQNLAISTAEHWLMSEVAGGVLTAKHDSQPSSGSIRAARQCARNTVSSKATPPEEEMQH